jgi:hypothetical protein
MEYPIVIEPDLETGGYVVTCPTFKGCVSQGCQRTWLIACGRPDALLHCPESN